MKTRGGGARLQAHARARRRLAPTPPRARRTSQGVDLVGWGAATRVLHGRNARQQHDPAHACARVREGVASRAGGGGVSRARRLPPPSAACPRPPPSTLPPCPRTRQQVGHVDDGRVGRGAYEPASHGVELPWSGGGARSGGRGAGRAQGGRRGDTVGQGAARALSHSATATPGHEMTPPRPRTQAYSQPEARRHSLTRCCTRVCVWGGGRWGARDVWGATTTARAREPAQHAPAGRYTHQETQNKRDETEGPDTRVSSARWLRRRQRRQRGGEAGASRRRPRTECS